MAEHSSPFEDWGDRKRWTVWTVWTGRKQEYSVHSAHTVHLVHRGVSAIRFAGLVFEGESRGMFFVSTAIIIATLSGCLPEDVAVRSNAETVTLFAAASTTDAVTEIVSRVEGRKDGVRVVTNFAASSTLARQIESGAPADVFLSANVEWVAYLEKRNLVAERHDLLGNRLVVVVPSASKLALQRPEDLVDHSVSRIAIGDPESVPAGIYAKQALTNLGLWDRLEGKCVPSMSVRQALLYVEQGETEAGIVYATDATLSQTVQVAFEIDPATHDRIVYPLVLLAGAERRDAARALFNVLAGADAADVFHASGFTVLGGDE